MARNIILRTIISCMVIYLIVLAYINYNQRELLYHPQPEIVGLDALNFPSVEEISFVTQDGTTIQAWYSKPEDPQKMIIFYHGNYGNLPHRVENLKKLKSMGYGFIIPSWRGFGKSEGSPTEEGIYQDARATIEFVQKQGYDLEDVIVIGESLGSGVATKMALEHQFKGIVLITPYTTISDRAAEIYFYLPVKYFLKDNFDNINNIHNITEPLLIIHGDQDDIIPHHHSLRIMEQANDPKKLVIYQGKNHTNYDMIEVIKEMNNFFDDKNHSHAIEEIVVQN